MGHSKAIYVIKFTTATPLAAVGR